MSKIQVSESAPIHAPAPTIYALLADYSTHHPRILPKPYFTSLKIDEGGQGAGTVFTAQMNVMGNRSTFRMRVSEPEPGHILAETDLDTGLVTTFTITPKGDHSEVTIKTIYERKAGFSGWLEGWITPMFMRKIYREELHLIDQYAQKMNETTP